MRRRRFRLAKRKAVTRGLAEPERVGYDPARRLRVIGVIGLSLFALLPLRLWGLQILSSRRYRAAAIADYLRTVAIPAPRGPIVDRAGIVLAGDATEYDLVISRTEAARHPASLAALAALAGEPVAQARAALADPRYDQFQPVPVVRAASMDELQFVEEHPRRFRGVGIQPAVGRTYPQGGAVATAVLGHVGPISATELASHAGDGYRPTSTFGQDGVEAEYQSYLRGVPGRQELAVNATGTHALRLSSTPPKPGDTVELHLDLPLQGYVDHALASGIVADRQSVDPTTGRHPEAVDGAVVVLDPRDGAVLAMASYPTYDLNEWRGGISSSQYSAILASGAEENFAIQGLYTPGSTFKLATATAALEQGLLTPSSVYADSGTFTIPNCTGGCTFHDASPSDAGRITMPLALTESDDDYFYNIGYQFWAQQPRYGTDPIQQAARSYGLGSLTGIDLPGEAAGRVDSPQLRQRLHQLSPSAFPVTSWYAGDNLELAFGQGATVITPIEMADAYATFANGGTRYQPEVAAAILSPSGRLLMRIAPKVTGHVTLPPSDYQAMLQGFEGAVSSPRGTAYADFTGFPLQTFPLAGKTGTASVSHAVEPDSWFVGFGPLPNPQYVVVAAIGEGGYGSEGAAPIVRKVFNYLLAHPVPPLRLPPSS